MARGWPLERLLLSALLAALVFPWFLLLTVLGGLNQWLFDGGCACAASLVLERALGIEKGCGR